MEQEIVQAFAPKLKNDRASAPEIVGKYDSLTNFSTVFRPSLCPQKRGQRHAQAFAPKIEEENGSTNKYKTRILPFFCPKGFKITASHIDLPAAPQVKRKLTPI